MAGISVDASDFFRLSKQLHNLPPKIKFRVINRSLYRMQERGRTEVKKLAAKRINIAQKHIAPLIHLPFGSGQTNSREIVVKSGWIPLSKLGAKKGKRGVSVPKRGSYRHAFLATMSSGHSGVFRRTGKSRLPIYQLYGPNPANDIATSPEVYQKLLDELITDKLADRMLHELGRILPK